MAQEKYTITLLNQDGYYAGTLVLPTENLALKIAKLIDEEAYETQGPYVQRVTDNNGGVIKGDEHISMSHI